MPGMKRKWQISPESFPSHAATNASSPLQDCSGEASAGAPGLLRDSGGRTEERPEPAREREATAPFGGVGRASQRSSVGLRFCELMRANKGDVRKERSGR